MALEEKIKRLKNICSKYKTEEFLTFVAGILLQTPTRHENPYLKDLMSPLRQLFFISLLNLQKIGQGDKVGFSEDEWAEMASLLGEIEMEYFHLLGFPKQGKESAEEIEKIRVVMPTFMNYFFNGPLSYQEQEIEKIERIFKHFGQQINDKFGLSLTDFISFYDFINDEISKNINKATQFFNPENWQAFTQKCIDKGLYDPQDWVKEGADEMVAFMNFSQNPGSFLQVDLDLMTYPTISNEKVKFIFDLFSSENQPKEEITFYTESNILLEKPFFKINDHKYLVFSLKQFLNAAYNFLFKYFLTLNQDKILKNRDDFMELKTLELFESFFKTTAHIYTNYSIDNISEQDILILLKETAIIIEVKATGYRAPMRDHEKAFEKLKSDFKKNIQYGYTQTFRVKEKFIENTKFNIFNEKKEVLFEINPRKYRNVFSIIVTLERFGQIQTNLSEMLEIDERDDYPWSVNIDDLEVFLLVLAKRKNKIQSLISFLDGREYYTGHLICGDELEICGLFLGKERDFKNWGLREEIIVTNADLTEPIEKEYAHGLGFKNERFLEQKKSTLFLYNKKYD